MKANKNKSRMGGLKIDLTNIENIEFEKINNKLTVST